MNVNKPIIQPYPGDANVLEQLNQSVFPLFFNVWREPTTCVVLGKGNKEENELHFAAIEENSIPVYRREGGGGSVVLTPGMLILAVAARVQDIFGSKRFFRLIQTPIQEALTAVGIPDVQQLGISDLASGDRKILGSSMRRQGPVLLYQSALLVDVDRSIFETYLQHPPREPDYRQGRSHDSFTISLRELGYEGSLEQLQATLEEHFARRLPELLAQEFVPSSSV